MSSGRKEQRRSWHSPRNPYFESESLFAFKQGLHVVLSRGLTRDRTHDPTKPDIDRRRFGYRMRLLAIFLLSRQVRTVLHHHGRYNDGPAWLPLGSVRKGRPSWPWLFGRNWPTLPHFGQLWVWISVEIAGPSRNNAHRYATGIVSTRRANLPSESCNLVQRNRLGVMSMMGPYRSLVLPSKTAPSFSYHPILSSCASAS